MRLCRAVQRARPTLRYEVTKVNTHTSLVEAMLQMAAKNRAQLGLARRQGRCGIGRQSARLHPRVLAKSVGHPRAAALAGERIDGN